MNTATAMPLDRYRDALARIQPQLAGRDEALTDERTLLPSRSEVSDFRGVIADDRIRE